MSIITQSVNHSRRITPAQKVKLMAERATVNASLMVGLRDAEAKTPGKFIELVSPTFQTSARQFADVGTVEVHEQHGKFFARLAGEEIRTFARAKADGQTDSDFVGVLIEADFDPARRGHFVLLSTPDLRAAARRFHQNSRRYVEVMEAHGDVYARMIDSK